MFVDWPVLHAGEEGLLRHANEFKSGDLSSTAWAFATFQVQNRPVFRAIACAASFQASSFNKQALTNMVWAFAAVVYFDEPL
mmetsp:Transcript_65301/g.153739  ORF Transcript_65301/g.153739 Transcript_65301/m.153739 type:complete len:82 (-) Transcript_65301:145-390(-)